MKMNLRLVSEFYGTFGTKYFLEIETLANTSVVEVSETVFERIKREQDFDVRPSFREKALPAKVEICNQRKEWTINGHT